MSGNLADRHLVAQCPASDDTQKFLVDHSISPRLNPSGQRVHMGQFSTKIPGATGSLLSGNQQSGGASCRTRSSLKGVSEWRHRETTAACLTSRRHPLHVRIKPDCQGATLLQCFVLGQPVLGLLSRRGGALSCRAATTLDSRRASCVGLCAAKSATGLILSEMARQLSNCVFPDPWREEYYIRLSTQSCRVQDTTRSISWIRQL